MFFEPPNILCSPKLVSLEDLRNERKVGVGFDLQGRLAKSKSAGHADLKRKSGKCRVSLCGRLVGRCCATACKSSATGSKPRVRALPRALTRNDADAHVNVTRVNVVDTCRASNPWVVVTSTVSQMHRHRHSHSRSL